MSNRVSHLLVPHFLPGGASVTILHVEANETRNITYVTMLNAFNHSNAPVSVTSCWLRF